MHTEGKGQHGMWHKITVLKTSCTTNIDGIVPLLVYIDFPCLKFIEDHRNITTQKIINSHWLLNKPVCVFESD